MLVAIKTVSPLVGDDRGALDRLKDEARAAIRLTHPHIVRVNAFEDAGAPGWDRGAARGRATGSGGTAASAASCGTQLRTGGDQTPSPCGGPCRCCHPGRDHRGLVCGEAAGVAGDDAGSPDRRSTGARAGGTGATRRKAGRHDAERGRAISVLSDGSPNRRARHSARAADARNHGLRRSTGNWEFDEGSGSAVLDSSGCSNHGTLSGVERVAEARPGSAGSAALRFNGHACVTVPDSGSLTSPVITMIETQHALKPNRWQEITATEPAGCGGDIGLRCVRQGKEGLWLRACGQW